MYRVDRRWAGEILGPLAVAAVPASGLVDVHTYLTVSEGGEPIHIDVTFDLATPWTGDVRMPLRCGEGFDVRRGKFPDRTKRELVALHCEAAVREPFITALSRCLGAGPVGRQ